MSVIKETHPSKHESTGQSEFDSHLHFMPSALMKNQKPFHSRDQANKDIQSALMIDRVDPKEGAAPQLPNSNTLRKSSKTKSQLMIKPRAKIAE